MTTLRRRTNSDREQESGLIKVEHFPRGNHKQVFIPSSDMACRDRTGEFMSVVKNKVSFIRNIFTHDNVIEITANIFCCHIGITLNSLQVLSEYFYSSKNNKYFGYLFCRLNFFKYQLCFL